MLLELNFYIFLGLQIMRQIQGVLDGHEDDVVQALPLSKLVVAICHVIWDRLTRRMNFSGLSLKVYYCQKIYIFLFLRPLRSPQWVHADDLSKIDGILAIVRK